MVMGDSPPSDAVVAADAPADAAPVVSAWGLTGCAWPS